MADIVRCTDRWHRTIVLSKERWATHVLTRHPEFRGLEALVELTLTDPAFVNHDRAHSDREFFYRPSPLPDPFDGLLVRVIIYFGAVGEVAIAHLIARPNRRETRKWP